MSAAGCLIGMVYCSRQGACLQQGASLAWCIAAAWAHVCSGVPHWPGLLQQPGRMSAAGCHVGLVYCSTHYIHTHEWGIQPLANDYIATREWTVQPLANDYTATREWLCSHSRMTSAGFRCRRRSLNLISIFPVPRFHFHFHFQIPFPILTSPSKEKENGKHAWVNTILLMIAQMPPCIFCETMKMNHS